MEDQEAKVRKARLCRFFFLSHMCHGTLLIVSTLAEFLGDCYDRVGSQVQDWPTGGETSFTRIYDGDIIKINEDSHWSWNNTVHLCSRAHLPCSLTIVGNPDARSTLLRPGSGAMTCKTENGCVGIVLREVVVNCSKQTVATRAPFQIQGASSSLLVERSVLSDCQSIDDGGAVLAYDNAIVTMLASTIQRSSTQGKGGGVALVGAHAHFTSSYFVGCTSEAGGAVWASGLARYPNVPIQSTVELLACEFMNNSAVTGGAVAVDTESLIVIQEVAFTHNLARGDGGAIALSAAARATVINSNFGWNFAAAVGGAVATLQASATIQSSRFYENIAVGLGGAALHMSVSTVDLFANIFHGNSAPSGGGGAVLWDGLSPVVRMACDLGWFADAGQYENLAFCTPCPPGSFKDSVEARVCTLCDSGTYSPAVGATSLTTCIPCEAGKYQNATGSSMCEFCSSNSDSLGGSVSPSFCLCNAGYSGTAGNCVACAPGEYKIFRGNLDIESSLTCSGSCLCEPSSGQSTGIFSDGPGKYGDSQTCSWLIASVAQIDVHFTLFETESNMDTVTINQCSSSDCESTKEIAKLSGSAVSADTTFSSSTGFMQVVFASDGSTTAEGFVASWSIAVMAGCAECPTASYSGASGVSTCTLCEAGKYQNQTGSSHCELCINADSPAGSMGCTCDAGYYYEDSGSCRACTPGTYKTPKESLDTAVICSGSCPCDATSGLASGALSDGPGTYANSQTCSWLIVSPTFEINLRFPSFDTVSDQDFVTINRCTSAACGVKLYTILLDGGSYPSEVSVKIVDSSGTAVFQLQATQQSGDSGTVDLMGGETYTIIPRDSYGDGWQSATVQVQVDGSTAVSIGASEVTGNGGTSQAKTFVGVGGTKEELAKLSGNAVSTDTVYSSSTGFLQVVFESDSSVTGNGFEAAWSVSAGAYCEPCSVGTYAGASGASACALCEAGTYQNATGATECETCVTNAASVAGGTTCSCNAGYVGNGMISCDACAPGTYSPFEVSKFCTSSQTSAPACEIVFSSIPLHSRVTITVEVANTDFSSSTEYISALIVGGQTIGTEHLKADGEDGKCDKLSKILDAVALPADVVSAAGEIAVRIETTSDVGCCPCDGSTLYSIVTINVEDGCGPCSAGTYAGTPGASACELCQAGTYENTKGSSACKQCPLYTNSTAGSEACACDPGYYGDSQTCVACAPGTYKGERTDLATSFTCSGPCDCEEAQGAASGTFSDGPGDYGNMATCTWLISSPSSEITLRFLSFDSEYQFDFVTINRCEDPECQSPEQIGRLSGTPLRASLAERAAPAVSTNPLLGTRGTASCKCTLQKCHQGIVRQKYDTD